MNRKAIFKRLGALDVNSNQIKFIEQLPHKVMGWSRADFKKTDIFHNWDKKKAREAVELVRQLKALDDEEEEYKTTRTPASASRKSAFRAAQPPAAASSARKKELTAPRTPSSDAETMPSSDAETTPSPDVKKSKAKIKEASAALKTGGIKMEPVLPNAKAAPTSKAMKKAVAEKSLNAAKPKEEEDQASLPFTAQTLKKRGDRGLKSDVSRDAKTPSDDTKSSGKWQMETRRKGMAKLALKTDGIITAGDVADDGTLTLHSGKVQPNEVLYQRDGEGYRRMVYVGTNQGRGQVQLQEAGEDDKPKGKMKYATYKWLITADKFNSLEKEKKKPKVEKPEEAEEERPKRAKLAQNMTEEEVSGLPEKSHVHE